jgi:sulfopyruvate decarboxylase alpha subunit
MDSGKFTVLLKENNFRFVTGVPCSYFNSLINDFYRDPYFSHFPAVREDIAVGMSAGAYLSGELPIIYMQNSGLGYSLEAFASIHMIYHIPTLVLVSYRGPEDPGMDEHKIMGAHTIELLKSFKLDYSVLDTHIESKEFEAIKRQMVESKLPYFLLAKKGSFS